MWEVKNISLKEEISFIKVNGRSLMIFLLLTAFFIPSNSYCKDYYTTQSGKWTAAFNWNQSWPKDTSDNADVRDSIYVENDPTVGDVSFKQGGEITVNSTGSLTIDGTLDLTNGSITVNNGGELILTENATLTGITDSNYIDGPYKIKGSDSIVFKLKGANGIVKLAIHKLTSLSTFQVEYKGGNPQNVFSDSMDSTLEYVSHSEYFQIKRTDGTGTAKVTLFWNKQGTNTQISNLQSLNDLTVAHYNGTKWQNIGNSFVIGNNDTGYVTSNTINSFSPFTFGSTSASSPLPVEMLYFKAKQIKPGKLKLHWATASETNNAFFLIQRKIGKGSDFETIGRIQGNGNSLKRSYYSFTDTIRANKILYYRLKQTDFDGSYTFSRVRAVKSASSSNQATFSVESIYPNPINENFNIKLTSTFQHKIELSIIDLKGNVQFKKQIQVLEGINYFRISNLNLTSGQYILQGKSNREKFSKNLLVK